MLRMCLNLRKFLVREGTYLDMRIDVLHADPPVKILDHPWRADTQMHFELVNLKSIARPLQLRRFPEWQRTEVI